MYLCFLRRLWRSDRGFTLIELIVVIAIIAIIAAVAAPRIANHIDSARVSADKANVSTLNALVNLYYIEAGVFPDNLDDLEGVYLREPVTTPYPDLVNEGDYNGYNYNNTTGKVTSVAAEDERY